MKTYNLCLLGFGNVGRALAQLLVAKTDELRAQHNIEWRITGVATRRMGWRVNPAGFDVDALLAKADAATTAAAFITTESVAPDAAVVVASPPSDVRAWLAAARADVLFETTSLEPFTGQPAVAHIRAALEAGAHAVTANKGAVVHGYRELSALARHRGRRFLFEATVADCLPVFSLFRECLPAAHVQGFRGILNSTTTVILEALAAGGTFADGVAHAQSLGITETDYSYDVDGWDAAVKVCALANVILDAPLSLNEIIREGIRDLDATTVRAARAANTPYKLVSRAERQDGGRVVARVRPEQIAADDPLAAVSGTTLSVNFALDVLPGLTLTAHAPNLQSTAYGLLADFINAVRT